jgi:hypothetical protein
VATVKIGRRSHVDTKALRAKHPQAARECTVTKAGPYVHVKPKIVEAVLAALPAPEGAAPA